MSMANSKAAKAKVAREEAGVQLQKGEQASTWREFEQQARRRMAEGEFSLPRMLEKVLRNTLIMETVLKVKVMGGILATQGSHAHRGAGGRAMKCRLCGKEEDGGETNFHVLWQCIGYCSQECADSIFCLSYMHLLSQG